MKCYECKNLATENHHVIPKVSGGVKTIPLCSACHNKVHGLGGERRDNHRENIARGIDEKHRANNLWITYQILKDANGITSDALEDLTSQIEWAKKNNVEPSINKGIFARCLIRLQSNDNEYWYSFFETNGYFKRKFQMYFTFL